MASYQTVSEINGLIDAIALCFTPENLTSLKEVGIFQSPPPSHLPTSLPLAMRHIDGNIGLASWSLTPLYVAAKRRLIEHPTDARATTAILVASPEYTTAWNIRKEHLTLASVPFELSFSRLLLSRSPKSAATWSHRAWVLATFGCDHQQIKRELALAWFAASRAPHNYYAGVHRMRLLPKLPRMLLKTEVAKSRKWLQCHVKDSSGWWYHRMLIRNLRMLEPTVIHDETLWFCDMRERYHTNNQNIKLYIKTCDWIND